MFQITQNIYLTDKAVQSYRRTKKKNVVEYEIHVKHIIIDDEERFYDDEGQLHRDDGPALINSSGHEWYRHGKLHREGGPALIKPKLYNRNAWYIDGQLHRENGPAFTQSGVQMWYKEGQLHREGGPAFVTKAKQEWWEHGVKIK